MLALTVLNLSLIPEPFSPVLAAIGGVLLIGSIVYSVATDDAIRGLFRNGSKKWFLGQTRTFRKGTHYNKQKGALDGPTQTLEDAILNAEFFYADESQAGVLRRCVCIDEEVEMLLGKKVAPEAQPQAAPAAAPAS